MASRFAAALLLFSLPFHVATASFGCTITGDDDNAGGSNLLIRQVVDHGQGDENADRRRFTSFKRNFGKAYATQEEHDYRFSIFKSNLRRARKHQRLDPSAVHGVTQFSDLTPREFRHHFLGLNRRIRLPSHARKADILPTNDLPSEFDWREHGAVTPVKYQGVCSSCWSFSAAGALEGANFLANGDLVSLSKQQLVDCDHECDPEEEDRCDSGCSGGLMNTAFEYLLKSGGLMREKDYPYAGTDRGVCKFDKFKIAAKVANFSVVSPDEGQMAANLVKNGPLTAAVDSVFMHTYVEGVLCPSECSKEVDHGVLLVGYGNTSQNQRPYWIIKNSWGENWGEEGFCKICRGHNICGVDSLVSSVAAVRT